MKSYQTHKREKRTTYMAKKGCNMVPTVTFKLKAAIRASQNNLFRAFLLETFSWTTSLQADEKETVIRRLKIAKDLTTFEGKTVVLQKFVSMASVR